MTGRVRARLMAALLVASLVATSGVAIATPMSAAGATWLVTNCGDMGPGSLRQVVAEAGPGDEIGFALAPACSEITLTSGPIEIATSMTIDGSGADVLAVTAQGGSGLFLVDGGVTASISGLTLEDSGDSSAGAVDNYGTLNISGSTFSGNNATYGGGAINNYGTLSVTTSTLSDNSAPYGGAISNEGTAVISDSTFTSDTASQGGGAIANSGTPTSLAAITVLASTVLDNSALWGGGIDNGFGSATVSQSTVSDNTTSGAGGGIFNGSTEADLSSLVVTQSTVAGNSAANGGGIESDGALQISNSTLAQNWAYNFGGGLDDDSTAAAAVTSTTFTQDTAPTGTGGAINDQAAASTLTATIVANSAPAQDCDGPVTDGGYNLADDGSCALSGTSLPDTPAGLDPTGLGANGGPTTTIALEPGSTAIGAVNDPTVCAAPDQRGNERVTPCDMGAYQTPAAQDITFTSTPPTDAFVGGPTYQASAIGGGSGDPVLLSIDTPSAPVCSLTGSTVSFTEPGTCTVDANQAGNGIYADAQQAQQSFAVAQAPQSVMFVSSPPTDAVVAGASYTPSVSGGASGNPVTTIIDSSSASVCTIADGVVSFIGAGTCTLDASQAGNTDYSAAAPVSQSFEVQPATQTIVMTSTPPPDAIVDDPYTVTATGGGSGNPVLFSSATTAVCAVTGASVQFVGVGTCTIDANQAGSPGWSAAPTVTQSFAVGKGTQTIAFSSPAPTQGVVGGWFLPTAAASPSGLPVAFSVSHASSSVCEMAGIELIFLKSGICTLLANQGGSAIFAAAPRLSTTITVKRAQAVAITSAAKKTTKVGAAFRVTVKTKGFPTAYLAEAGTLPSGVTFTDNGNGTATLAGTPTTGSGGIYPVTISASNTQGSVDQVFILTVDQPPTISSANRATFTVGNSGSFQVTASGYPAVTLSEGGTLPSGVTFTSAGVLSGTPAAGTSGIYTFTVIASNRGRPNATQSFTLTVDQSLVITS